MRLVDTSAWIEWLVESKIADAVDAELPSLEAWLVPSIVQLELSKWLVRQLGEETADRVIAFSERCIVVDLDTRLALAAAEACERHKLATADAVIYATAQAWGADVLTCDAHFAKLPNVCFISK